MAKLILSDLASLENETSALAVLASNNAALETALENTLSRDGTSPNSMSAPLDMNSQRIMNLPAPVSGSEPVTKSYLEAFPGGLPLTLADIRHYPVVHPSSGNLQGSGRPNTHQLMWNDSNPVFYADAFFMNCNDPSALCSIPFSGTPVAGNTITLNFHFNSTVVPVTYTVQAGDTLTSIASGFQAAIRATPAIHVPVSENNTYGGGEPGPVLYAEAAGTAIHFDFDCRVALSMTTSNVGSVVATLPQTHPTLLSKAWDANPLMFFGRAVEGIAPPTGSNIFNLVVGGGNSASPGVINTQYASIGVQVLSSTVNNISSRFQFLTPSASGAIDGGGFYAGLGIYTPSVTGGDKGKDTINVKGVFVEGNNILSQQVSNYKRVTDFDVTAVANYTVLPFETASIANTNYNTSLYRFTAPHAGVFEVAAAIDIVLTDRTTTPGSPVGSNTTAVVGFRKVGGAPFYQQTHPNFGANSLSTCTIRDVVELAAGEAVEVIIYPVSAKLYIYGSQQGTRFSVIECARP